MANHTAQHGFTIIEALINIMIISAVGLAILSGVVGGLRFTQLSKERVLGLAIVNGIMEDLRNLPYDELATQTGTIVPPGTIPDVQTMIRENVTFTVRIRIDYQDDPFDGDAFGSVQGKPIDLAPYDYKKVEISATRLNRTKPSAKIVSNVSASAAETASGTGILVVNVLDASGGPVFEANVTVTNGSVTPAVNINTTTDIAGRVMIPSLPPDNQNRYHVEATKTGFSTDRTVPLTSPNPVQPDLNIFIQQITSQTLIIDELASMTVTLLDDADAPVTNQQVVVTSSELTYANPNIPKYQSTQTTDAQGQFTVNQMEFDSYTLVPATPYNVCATAPFQAVPLDPATALSVTIRATTSSNGPRITGINPTTTGNAPVDLTINGSNFVFGASVLLQRSGQTDIAAAPVVVDPGGDQITATVDLTAALDGLWDIRVTNPDAQQCRQPDGLIIN